MAMSAPMQIQIGDYFYWMGIVILFYDHAVTLGLEIEYAWKRPKRPIWFLINRYFGFFANLALAVVLYIPVDSLKPCAARVPLLYFRSVVLVVSEGIVCILLAIRTYALYGGDRRVIWVSSVVFCAMVAMAGIAAFAFNGDSESYGCNNGLSLRSGALTSLPWITLFLWDALIFVLTFRKTYQSMTQARATLLGSGDDDHEWVPLTTVILRDGAIYFCSMAFANVANVLMFYLAPPFLRGSLVSFASSVSVAMMSRMMLSLYETSKVPDNTSTIEPTSAISRSRTRAEPAFAMRKYPEDDF